MDTLGSNYFGLDIECEDIGGDNEDNDVLNDTPSMANNCQKLNELVTSLAPNCLYSLKPHTKTDHHNCILKSVEVLKWLQLRN